jgi:Leucine-rich repeat (LRR) protein
MTGLARWDLAENQIQEIPSEIGALQQLQHLDLTRNKIQHLPAEIGLLKSLKELLLPHNQLVDLPAEIGMLAGLRMLDLRHNKLKRLPPSIGRLLRTGTTIKLDGNPLEEPFPGLLERGANALATYLEALAEGADHQHEAKIVLIGEGNVGKTSLVASLLGQPFVMDRPTTHGIEVHTLELGHPTKKGVTLSLRLWDFGGQEVYRITHQFFFSQRALYVIVWNAREGQEQNEVEGWLRRVRLRVGNGTRALIVATHINERQPELDYPSLNRQYPGILFGQHAIDNQNGAGLGHLRKAIAEVASALPQMGTLMSSRWITVRARIRKIATSEPHITLSRFTSIADAAGVKEGDRATLLELLHDLGQIIYYGDDEGLRDIVVLNPEWLTKAIGLVLEDGPTRERHGVLDHSRLTEIWSDRDEANYDPSYYPYFLRLMEKFDVSYRLSDPGNASLVAQLVPHERPPLPWDFGSELMPGVRKLSVNCELSEPAPGLVAWLTVRHHDASIDRHWRTGVFLRHPIAAYASEGLIQASGATLKIEVRAPSPDLFFNVLRDSVEHLLRRRWPGLEYALQIPCTGIGCGIGIPLDGLTRYRERGGTTYTCLNCQTDHDIGELLAGFSFGQQSDSAGLDVLQRQIDAITDGIDRVEKLAARTADSMRRVMKAISVEVTDSPRLFVIEPRAPQGLGERLQMHRRWCDVTLLCEQPGAWHPLPEATYTWARSKEWLIEVAPYAQMVLRAVRVAVPIAAALAAAAVPEDFLSRVNGSLEFMKAASLALSDNELDVADPSHRFDTLSPAQGKALRAFRSLLFKLDPPRIFGDLRRVQAASGEFLWVCAEHNRLYDPGLPVLA